MYFYAFNVIEGMEAFGEIADSRGKLLEAAESLGFDICPFVRLERNAQLEEIEAGIEKLKLLAEDMDLPIDGICGEKPGSKLAKARELGVPVLTEQEFIEMIPA